MQERQALVQGKAAARREDIELKKREEQQQMEVPHTLAGFK